MKEKFENILQTTLYFYLALAALSFIITIPLHVIFPVGALSVSFLLINIQNAKKNALYEEKLEERQISKREKEEMEKSFKELVLNSITNVLNDKWIIYILIWIVMAISLYVIPVGLFIVIIEKHFISLGLSLILAVVPVILFILNQKDNKERLEASEPVEEFEKKIQHYLPEE